MGINVWWWSLPDTDSKSFFPFPSPLRNKRVWEIYWHFSYIHRPIFTTLGEMTDTDKVTNHTTKQEVKVI